MREMSWALTPRWLCWSGKQLQVDYCDFFCYWYLCWYVGCDFFCYCYLCWYVGYHNYCNCESNNFSL